MSRTRFSQISPLPSRESLEKLVDNLTYKKLAVDELPSELRSIGVTDKFNSVFASASGSIGGAMVFSFNGLRIDNDKIDEHPFVIYFDGEDSTKDFGGLIHHGDWAERTTFLDPHQESALSASGITADFTYKGIPPGTSGSLYDLDHNGMLVGFKRQATVLFKNKEKN